jgi:hypothetical protein
MDEYPDGVKYRTSTWLKTAERYSDSPTTNHPSVDRHHYHTSTDVYDGIEYTGLKAHIQKFYNEIDDRRGR